MNNDNRRKGKRPRQPSPTPSVEDITDLVDELAARHGISRDAAIRMLANRPGTSAQHRSLGSHVLDNPGLANLIAGHLHGGNLARFGAVSRTARDAFRQQPGNRLRDRIFRSDVQAPKMAQHTKKKPFPGLQWRSRMWTYDDTGGYFCRAIPSGFMRQFPSKAALLARLQELEDPVKSLQVSFGALQGGLRRVINSAAVGLLSAATAAELKRFLEELLAWGWAWGDVFADLRNRRRFIRLAGALSYHALYIVLALMRALKPWRGNGRRRT